jgi:uncharacterized glyoxalase superfamily protein PhnB
LRTIGLTPQDIGRALDGADTSLSSVVNRHIDQLDSQLAAGHRLRSRLAVLADAMATRQAPALREFLDVLEGMTMVDSTVQRRIPVLVHTDIEAAHRYLTEVLGLEAGRLDRDADGVVVHGEVTAGDGVIWLRRVAPEFGLDSPCNTGGVETAGLSVVVDDVDAHYPAGQRAGRGDPLRAAGHALRRARVRPA